MFGRRKRERDLDAELAFHVDEETAEQEADGVAVSEARARARRSLGNVTLARENTRDVWTWVSLERAIQDLRYALRVLRRRPAFTIAALLSLSLGMGASTAVFSLVDALFLERLPIPRPHELVQIVRGAGSSTYDEYKTLRESARQFSGVFGIAFVPATGAEIRDTDGRREVFLQVVTDNYFDVLGVSAMRGRVFHPRSAGQPGERSVVISERYWRQRYGGDPAAIGARYRQFNGPEEFTIIGILPPGFGGTHLDVAGDIWVALEDLGWDEADRIVRLQGRLAPGATIMSAQAEVRTLLTRPTTVRAGATGVSTLRAQLGQPLSLLGGLVALVFLVTCANLANLSLVGAAARERELALRRAIGASRGRVIRQLVTENLVLATMGGAGGLFVASAVSGALLRFLPPDQGRALVTLRFEPSARVLGFTLALCFLTSLLCGLIPALRATATPAAPALKHGGGSGHASRGWTSRCLVVSQVAMCALLLVIAGAFVRTLYNLRAQETGYVESGLLVADVMPTRQLGEDGSDRIKQAMLDRARGLPGVTMASFGHVGQMSGSTFNGPVRVGAGAEQNANEQRVTPGFLEAMGTRIIAGRDIAAADHARAPAVALVNAAFLRQFGISGNPIGQVFVKRGGSRGLEPITIVGVVEDAKWVTLREAPRAIYYRAYAQLSGSPQVRFAMRATGDLDALAAAFVQSARALDPGITLKNVVPFRDIVDRTLVTERLISQVAAALAAFALLVGAIGLYGVLAYGVARRRREIGVRMAIGAPRGAVAWMILRESLALLGIGLAAGVPAGMFVARLAESLLFGLSPWDPLVLIAASLVLAATTVGAAYFPARRAATINPVIALRDE
jgi:predicted permease